MRKVLLVLLVLLIALPITALAADAVNWDAIIESGAVADVLAEPVQTVQVVEPQGINWTDVVTKVVVWIIGGVGTVLSALLVSVTKKYIAPWLKDVAVPWLKSNGLLSAAQTAVKYAEAELGRYTGDDKWNMALSLLQKQGYNINSEPVIAALKSAWTDLNISQIAAGIKETECEGIDIADLTDEQVRALIHQMGATQGEIDACKTREDLEKLAEVMATDAVSMD